MKILYIENIRLPTEKAHGIQIMKMCEAFATAENEVVLVVPKRKNNINDDPFEYYKVKNNFIIRRLWVPNILFLGSIGFWIQTIFFAEVSAWYMFRWKPHIVYSREERILINLIFVAKNIIWESHRGAWNIVTKIIFRFAKKIVVISKGLENFYSIKSPQYSHKIILSPDGVDLELFDINISRSECREKLSLPKDKKIALYAGHLYKWKGAHVFAEASKRMNDNEIAMFVGGTSHDLTDFRSKYDQNKNCLILGQKSYKEIPLYLKAADVLILPNTAMDDIGSIYTSPLKLFEYMASGTPIIASDVPAIREILDESNAKIIPPDNEEVLFQAIKKIFKDDVVMSAIAKKARQDVEKYTWINRANNVITSRIK